MSKSLTFSEGFTHKGYKFGWHEGKLYRLPQKKKITEQKRKKFTREYPLKELTLIKLSDSGYGYRISTDKKSLAQVRGMTKALSPCVEIFECQECK